MQREIHAGHHVGAGEADVSDGPLIAVPARIAGEGLVVLFAASDALGRLILVALQSILVEKDELAVAAYGSAGKLDFLPHLVPAILLIQLEMLCAGELLTVLSKQVKINLALMPSFFDLHDVAEFSCQADFHAPEILPGSVLFPLYVRFLIVG